MCTGHYIMYLFNMFVFLYRFHWSKLPGKHTAACYVCFTSFSRATTNEKPCYSIVVFIIYYNCAVTALFRAIDMAVPCLTNDACMEKLLLLRYILAIADGVMFSYYAKKHISYWPPKMLEWVNFISFHLNNSISPVQNLQFIVPYENTKQNYLLARLKHIRYVNHINLLWSRAHSDVTPYK